MSAGPEYTEVERPLLDQLASMGWEVVQANAGDPASSERSSFREAILEDRLRNALRQINPGPLGESWLDDSRLGDAMSALTRPGIGNLVEINETVTDLLITGTSVSGLPGWDQGRTQRVHFIDFERPENNDFLAISQFRMDEPGTQGRKYIAPDIVLFVNGLPLVVIECKSPYITDPMAAGIKQLRRYANQRQLGLPEGNEKLFWSNQFVVSTYGVSARVGTFTSGSEHFLEWRDVTPLTHDQLAEMLGKSTTSITRQELLVAGMFDRANLLQLVRHFTLFMESDAKRVKVVARYQQFRAVDRALKNLRSGKTRLQDGEHDRRGGLIWHTQGSGKSLTMVFLVRAMRSDPLLRTFKIVIVTDRTDLEKQLLATLKLSGDTVRRARNSNALKRLLAVAGPALVFAMIQKYRDTDTAMPENGDDVWDEVSTTTMGEVNAADSIVVLVDEAHRSQTSTLHANLMAALPNAAKIGFTGTPIMRDGKKKTDEIFGAEIDRYTIRDAEADGAVLPILYEGKTAKGAVAGGSDLDDLFEDMFDAHTPEESDALKKRFATTGAVLEAPELIAGKARSMVWHYVSSILPGGFKGQVAVSSRLAAVRYRLALTAARDDLLAQIGELPADLIEGCRLGTIDIDELDRKTQILLRARAHADIISILEFVPVISEDDNDDPTWRRWTDKSHQDTAIANFKKRLGPPGDKSSPVAFLIVRTMLLTGFDAPIEQVLYLDRSIQDAELLQAVARVNRTASGKSAGYVVDYYGVSSHLESALRTYAPEDAADSVGAMRSIGDELPKLRDRRDRVLAIFTQGGIGSFDTAEDIEACVEVLSDEMLRVRFAVLLKQFLRTLDAVLPRPEGLPFVGIAKRMGVIQAIARRRYREDGLGDFDPSLYGEKVRELIDEHIVALDIATKIPPVSITDTDFMSKVRRMPSDKAKASEMEHAARFHIRKDFDEDPARFTKLSQRLDEILKVLHGKWDQLALALEGLIGDLQSGLDSERVHDDPLVARFYGLLDARRPVSNEEWQQPAILDLSERVVAIIADRVRIVRFWGNAHLQDDLRRALIHELDDADAFPFDSQSAIADELFELARANDSLFAHWEQTGGQSE